MRIYINLDKVCLASIRLNVNELCERNNDSTGSETSRRFPREAQIFGLMVDSLDARETETWN